jgi:hypothetical protein
MFGLGIPELVVFLGLLVLVIWLLRRHERRR